MCAHGLLKPVTTLMNKDECDELEATGLFHGLSLPFPFILAPNGKRNIETLKDAQTGEMLDLLCEGQFCGQLCVSEVFRIDKESRFRSIMGGDLTSRRARTIYQQMGHYAIAGDYSLEPLSYYANIAGLIEERKKALNAEYISAFILQANPLHRVHERIMRLCYDTCDLLVLFILKPIEDNGLIPFDLRLQILQFTIKNYFSDDRLLIIPIDDVCFFNGSNRVILDAIIMQNLGCNRFIIGRNYMGLSLFYANNKTHTIFDELKGIHLDVQILSEYVYCKQCGTIVSLTSCPHGAHHHIRYHTKSLLELFNLGIPPPTILVRKEISSMILARLYPHRYRRVEQLYREIIPSTGLLDEYNDSSFYGDFLSLYQIAMVN